MVLGEKHGTNYLPYTINLRIILFLEYRKTPETLRFRGILRLDTTLSYDNKSIFRLYYSMIVATRPDPTVRPPSRYQTGVLRCANGDFSCDLCGKIRIFRCIRVVFGDFVIMVLSHYFNYSMTVLFFLTLFSQVYFYNIYPLNFPLYLVSFLPTKHHFL